MAAADTTRAEASTTALNVRNCYAVARMPHVAESIQPATLVFFERFGLGIYAEIDVGGTRRRLDVYWVDHPALMLLGHCDRATLQSALIATKREAAHV